MGCIGSSGAREANEAEQQEMFRYAVKEMWILCASHFLQNGHQLKVKIPEPEARTIKAEVAEVERQESAKAVGGGGGVLNKLVELKDKAKHEIEKVVSKGHEAASSFIDGLKQTRDRCIDDVQVDLLEKSNQKLLQKFAEVIKTRQIDDARSLVRGAHPYGPGEYGKCPDNSASSDLYENHKREFKQILQEHLELDANTSVRAWGQLEEKIGKANELLGRPVFSMPFNIKDYIVDRTLLHMVEHMGEHEKTVRRAPSGMAKDHPETFEACFSGRTLMSTDYAKYKGRRGQ